MLSFILILFNQIHLPLSGGSVEGPISTINFSKPKQKNRILTLMDLLWMRSTSRSTDHLYSNILK